MTALDGYGDFDTKRLSSKPVNTILDKTDVFIFSHFAASEHQTSFSCPLIRYQVSGTQQLRNGLFGQFCHLEKGRILYGLVKKKQHIIVS